VVRPLPWRDHLKAINSSGSVSDQCGMGIWESQYFVSDLSAKMGDENWTVNNRALAHYGLVHQSAYLLLLRFEGFDCVSPSPQESRGSLNLSWIGLQTKLGCHPHALSLVSCAQFQHLFRQYFFEYPSFSRVASGGYWCCGAQQPNYHEYPSRSVYVCLFFHTTQFRGSYAELFVLYCDKTRILFVS
jgi:hypothetical protein